MKKKKIIAFIVVIALIIAIAAFAVVEIAVNHKPPSSILVKAGLPIASLVFFLVKLSTMQLRRPLSFYEQSYSEELRGAFSSSPMDRRKLLRAVRYYNENKFAFAISFLEGLKKKCRARADWEAVLLFIGLCHTDAGNPSAAIEAYRELIAQSPRCSRAYANLSFVYISQGDFSAALDCCRAAIEADPKNAHAYQNAASTYFKSGDYENAITNAKKALDLKGNFYQAATTLALSYATLGDNENCQKYATIAISNGQSKEKLQAAISSLRSSGSVFDALYRATAAPALHILLHDYKPSLKSIIGGKINEDAPTDASGNKMRLLAAFFMSELPETPLLPTRGVLRFYASENVLDEFDFEDPTSNSCFRVLFDEDEDSFTTAPIARDDDDDFPILGSFTPFFTKVSEGISPMDYRFSEVFAQILDENGISQSEHEALFEEAYERAHASLNKLGGYPAFAQEDPRDYNFNDEYDTLLFQLVSEDDEDKIMLGDCGNCQFFISKEKLAKRDFSDILFNFDCY